MESSKKKHSRNHGVWQLEAARRDFIVKALLALAVFFLLLQFSGYKYFVDDKTKPLVVNSPWTIVTTFTQTCDHLELPVFVVEPSLLRALRGGEDKVQLWDRGQHHLITFGILHATNHELHKLLSTLSDFIHLGINAEDPRDMTVHDRQHYRTIPTHYFLWHPGAVGPVIHLVIFYRRGDYVWFSAASHPKSVNPPVNASNLVVGRHAGIIRQFTIQMVKIRDITVSYPMDTSGFVWNLDHSKFIECDYARARHFFMKYSKKETDDMPDFRRAARQLLSIVSKVLDGLGVPFWISSGTCLGWYRQCDTIPYSKDVDIGIKIKDYTVDMITALELAGLQLAQQFGKVLDSLELSFFYGDLKLDIFFFYEENDHMWNGGTQAKTGNKFKYIFPKFNLSWTEFLGIRLRVPDPPLPYIEANYGKNWEIPVHDWDWKKSPANVVENGRWPIEHIDEVVQLYEVKKKRVVGQDNVVKMEIKDNEGLK